MQFTHVLPNGKEVQLEEILFKDLRTFNLYEDTSIRGKMDFLQSFILTKGLNVLEQFYALLYLREHCIGDNIIVNSNKGDVGVSIDFMRKNLDGIPDRQTVVTVDEAEYTLDIPYQFNTGNDDFILSLIKCIRIGDQTLDIPNLSKEEQQQVVERLPEQLYKSVDEFLSNNGEFFNLCVLDTVPGEIEIEPIEFSILQRLFTEFIVSLFRCVTTQGYREILFTLAKRINDVSFLANSTYLEVYDYFEMYAKEMQERDANQGSSPMG
jgi:hypothetical protein